MVAVNDFDKLALPETVGLKWADAEAEVVVAPISSTCVAVPKPVSTSRWAFCGMWVELTPIATTVLKLCDTEPKEECTEAVAGELAKLAAAAACLPALRVTAGDTPKAPVTDAGKADLNATTVGDIVKCAVSKFLLIQVEHTGSICGFSTIQQAFTLVDLAAITAGET